MKQKKLRQIKVNTCIKFAAIAVINHDEYFSRFVKAKEGVILVIKFLRRKIVLSVSYIYFFW